MKVFLKSRAVHAKGKQGWRIAAMSRRQLLGATCLCFAALGSGPASAIRSATRWSERFTGNWRRQWRVADHKAGSRIFASDWSAGQIDQTLNPDTAQGGGLTLRLDPFNGHPRGASISRHAASGHGRYSARLKAARGHGVVTGFFLYSGPAEGTPHDEIDFEVLGKETTAIRLSLWVDGKLTTRRVPLGFDAAKSFHDYEIHWTQDKVAWSIDGQPVHSLEAPHAAMPRADMRVFANIWAAGASLHRWAGRYQGRATSADLGAVRFSPALSAPVKNPV